MPCFFAHLELRSILTCKYSKIVIKTKEAEKVREQSPHTLYDIDTGTQATCVSGIWAQTCRLPDHDATRLIPANLPAKVGIWVYPVLPPSEAGQGPHRSHPHRKQNWERGPAPFIDRPASCGGAKGPE